MKLSPRTGRLSLSEGESDDDALRIAIQRICRVERRVAADREVDVYYLSTEPGFPLEYKRFGKWVYKFCRM